jgi:hypothetical protein
LKAEWPVVSGNPFLERDRSCGHSGPRLGHSMSGFLSGGTRPECRQGGMLSPALPTLRGIVLESSCDGVDSVLYMALDAESVEECRKREACYIWDFASRRVVLDALH